MVYKKHLLYYFSLIGILLVGAYFSLQFSYDKRIQMSILTITAFLYAAIGILHHYLHHDISTKIVIEYILMSSLAIAIAAFFIRGAFL